MSNRRSPKDAKELLANRLLAKSRSSAARVGADAVLPKPDEPVEAAFIARVMEADSPLMGAEDND